MELPPSSHDSTNAPFNLTLHDPSTYTLTPRLDHRWQPLVMIANLPHVEVLLTIKERDKPVKCMFMLDSGAGGVDAMFHSRAVRELGLIQDNKHGMRTLTVSLLSCSAACRRLQEATFKSQQRSSRTSCCSRASVKGILAYATHPLTHHVSVS